MLKILLLWLTPGSSVPLPRKKLDRDDHSGFHDSAGPNIVFSLCHATAEKCMFVITSGRQERRYICPQCTAPSCSLRKQNIGRERSQQEVGDAGGCKFYETFTFLLLRAQGNKIQKRKQAQLPHTLCPLKVTLVESRGIQGLGTCGATQLLSCLSS